MSDLDRAVEMVVRVFGADEVEVVGDGSDDLPDALPSNGKTMRYETSVTTP